MATESFPAVGDGGFTDDQWSVMYGSQDGIIEDYHVGGVDACAMTRNNTTNKVTIKPGLVRVNGYVLNIVSDTELSAEAPGAGTAVYTIAAQYDPALNVEEEDESASELGPCRLIITDDALDTSDGKQYTTLYTVTRTSAQTLTGATVADLRYWVGPVVVLPPGNSEPATPMPRGSIAVRPRIGTTSQSDILVRLPNLGPTPTAGTVLDWQSMLAPTSAPFPVVGGLVAASPSPAIMERFAGRMVHLSGSLRRSTSTNLMTGSNWVIGTLPFGWRPGTTKSFTIWAAGTVDAAKIVISSDGQVFLYDLVGAPTVTAIYLDNIIFRAAGV